MGREQSVNYDTHIFKSQNGKVYAYVVVNLPFCQGRVAVQTVICLVGSFLNVANTAAAPLSVKTYPINSKNGCSTVLRPYSHHIESGWQADGMDIPTPTNLSSASTMTHTFSSRRMGRYIPVYIKNGYRWAESNPELAENENVQQQWKFFERRQHRRRTAFRKDIPDKL